MFSGTGLWEGLVGAEGVRPICHSVELGLGTTGSVVQAVRFETGTCTDI